MTASAGGGTGLSTTVVAALRKNVSKGKDYKRGRKPQHQTTRIPTRPTYIAFLRAGVADDDEPLRFLFFFDAGVPTAVEVASIGATSASLDACNMGRQVR